MMTGSKGQVSMMYIRKTATGIHILFVFKNMCKVDKALLNSGASHNFFNLKTVERLGIQVEKLKEPIKVLNIDGTHNSARIIDAYALVNIMLRTQIKPQKFFIASLRGDWAILRYMFLREFNL
jgi:predicted aspartyl protease